MLNTDIKWVWIPICVSRLAAKYFGTLHECKKGNMRSYQDCSCQLEITSLFLSTFILLKVCILFSLVYIFQAYFKQVIKSSQVWLKIFYFTQFVNSIFNTFIPEMLTVYRRIPILARIFAAENSQIQSHWISYYEKKSAFVPDGSWKKIMVTGTGLELFDSSMDGPRKFRKNSSRIFPTRLSR